MSGGKDLTHFLVCAIVHTADVEIVSVRVKVKNHIRSRMAGDAHRDIEGHRAVSVVGLGHSCPDFCQ